MKRRKLSQKDWIDRAPVKAEPLTARNREEDELHMWVGPHVVWLLFAALHLQPCCPADAAICHVALFARSLGSFLSCWMLAGHRL